MKHRVKPKRLGRYKAGLWAEGIAAIYLRFKGYQIIERRYKTPGGEIDLIARRRKHFAFVEVKYRQSLDEAKFSLTDQQKRRINKAALFWLARNEHRYESLSFDVIVMAPWHWPLHIKSAFDEM